jgi:serine/threonine protein kinase/tetratricopeptide (TPR) repeat protein
MNSLRLDDEAIFHVARKIEAPEARAAYLDQVCGAASVLRGEVEILLSAYDRERSFLEAPAVEPPGGATAAWSTATEGPGATIGPYRLMEQIGEGGMGVVFVAEQTQPVRRRVALKVIKPGMDSRQVVSRFEAERQALAMMDHPNIARVFDGGTTPSGRPYFVMELVRGMPIIAYCDAERLSIRERLELFVLVCRAVQHAHQKGIIHRDLKPSNILLTLHDGVPVPKVIDFGVAKATGQSLTERTIYTAFTQLVGTPLYMSPEQVELSGLDVDTRSDIYSLGVLLYELVTGTTPFDSDTLKQAAFDEMRRIIREEEPPKPSTRLNTLGATLTATAARRSSDARQLNRSVRGELDWIVMKSLEKDRRRRYETANDFAADVMRYLTNQLVEACPPSVWYRVAKFARRNRAALTTATVLATALLLGSAFTAWQAIRAMHAERDAIAGWAEETRQRNRAAEEAQKAKESQADTQAFSDFLVEDVLAVARPEGVQGGLGVGVTVAQALEAAEATLEQRFAGRPLAEATARDSIGKTWRNVAKYEQAERHLRRAVELREQELGPDDPATLDSRNSLGVLLEQMGRYAEAISLHEATLKSRTAKLGLTDADTYSSMNNLAAAYCSAGNLDKALPLYVQALEKLKAQLGPDDPRTLRTMSNLAGVYQKAGQADKARALTQQTLELRKAKLGLDHPDTLNSMNDLATALQDAGQLDQAISLYQETLEKRKAKLGPEHPDTLLSMNNLALAHNAASQPDQALPLFEMALKKRKATLGPDHPDTFASMDGLAQAYRDAGELDRARVIYEETLEKRRVKLGPDHPDTLASMSGLASVYWRLRRLRESVPLFEEVLRIQHERLGDDHPSTLWAAYDLAVNYRDAGRLPEAEKVINEWLPRGRAKLGPGNPATLHGLETASSIQERMGRPAKAEPLRRELAALWKDKAGAGSPQYAQQLSSLGLDLLEHQKAADAEPVLRESLSIRKQTQPDVWTTFNTQSLLGGSLLGQKKNGEAERLLLSGYEGMKEREGKIPPQSKVRLTEALERLVQLYESRGQKEKADAWRKKRPVVKATKPADTKKD